MLWAAMVTHLILVVIVHQGQHVVLLRQDLAGNGRRHGEDGVAIQVAVNGARGERQVVAGDLREAMEATWGIGQRNNRCQASSDVATQ